MSHGLCSYMVTASDAEACCGAYKFGPPWSQQALETFHLYLIGNLFGAERTKRILMRFSGRVLILI